MLERIGAALLALGDLLLGWLLNLPSDAALLLAGLGTALILVYSRRFTTRQDLLKRCDADKARLGELVRKAKREGRKTDERRHRELKAVIRLKAARGEGRPLAAALIPLAILAIWCSHRLAYYPPGDRQVVEVRARFPVSTAGQVVHLVPQGGLEAPEGWVREIEAVVNDGAEPYGEARWMVRGAAREEPHELQIRRREDTYAHPMLVGQSRYCEPRVFHEGGGRNAWTETRLEERKLFGVVPGLEPLGLAPWMLAYLLIAVPAFFLSKRLLGIF